MKKCDSGPRADNRGILDPARLRREVRFRRRLPAAALLPYVEHYWLIDWDLDEPFEQRVLPHPAVNLVFRRDPADGPASGSAEVAGVGRGLFRITLAGTGRVSGVQFRPGGFRPFWPGPVAELTGERRPLPAGLVGGRHPCDGTDDERAATLDALLLTWHPRPASLPASPSAAGVAAASVPAADPPTAEALALAGEIRTDRSVLRVDDLARRHGTTTRRLQRLFLDHVGVGPKWVIRRYRIQEAIEHAASGGPVDWAAVAADLGYADQAHLIREFAAETGLTPAAYARSLHRPARSSLSRPG
ncbi:helix-turn-helix domain-containing protein [Micromonospora sp. WMMD712]|uniref:helix-turn-helix domain-containing protein n=1 Tax=Micromonospora sp. WMMD712 TaxID=3016096 RepID=UPI00249C6D50|nr:helix-turn-helix domain-containing protein [Micromonospora sp. WMMD712]WFE59068.1 helix-turn-helix domain-containing protein [Micromonospora sp. WMMD712]